jgi:Family of unknown function (DUF6390)
MPDGTSALRRDQTLIGPPAAPTGPLLFARYAYPPNELGYCGPADHRSLLEYAATGISDSGLAQLARGFGGAWPYLQLIAHATGLGDPLDRRVVEAYWVGNRLLDQIGPGALGGSLDERFRRQAGSQFRFVAEAVAAGAVPHHSFHVFSVYPWVGLLGHDRKGSHALTVLDQCRIRWGRVVTVEGDQVVVRSRPLTWDGRRLALGPSVLETACRATDGRGFLAELAPDDWVSLHWHWVCDRLSSAQVATLRRYTLHQLDITNHHTLHTGTAAALG